LENEIDAMEEALPPMTHFVLPGGHTTVSYCHIARCVCRRAERKLAGLADTLVLPPAMTVFINRLSDLLFVLARILARSEGDDEIYWNRDV